MDKIKLELNKTNDNVLEINKWIKQTEYISKNHFKINDEIKVEDFYLPDNMRVIATISKGKKMYCKCENWTFH